MKKRILTFLIVFCLMFVTIANAAGNQQLAEIPNATVSVNYIDSLENVPKSQSVKAEALIVNGHYMIPLQSFRDLSTEANRFLFTATYTKAMGHILFNLGLGKNKIHIYIDKQDYDLVDSDWKTIISDKLTQSPIVYKDTPYLPLQIIEALGYSYSVDKDKITINIASTTSELPYIIDVNHEEETVILDVDGNDVEYKLIGVNIPDSKEVYEKYTLQYVNYLKGKKVEIKRNSTVTDATYKYEPVYLYLPSEKYSVNEEILGLGYAYYQNDGGDLDENLRAAASFAKSNQLSIYYVSDKDAPVVKTNKTYEVRAINGYKVTLAQGNKTYTVDFQDSSLPSILRQYVSYSLTFIENKLIGKNIELKVNPETNYEFILYIMDYIQGNKGL